MSTDDSSSLDEEIQRSALFGSSYVIRRDPACPGVSQLAVRSPDGSVGGAWLDRDGMRLLDADVLRVGDLRHTPAMIGRSQEAVVLASAMRRNLELLRELWNRDPVAAEALLKSLFDHIRSWDSWVPLAP